jgi:stalled ribosome rescue protein Dom34
MKRPPPKTPFHCLVWIDHCMARIFAVTHREMTELVTLHAPDEGRGHIHHHAGTPGSGHEPMSEEYLKKVADALGDPAEILIAGPAQAKQILKAYLAKKTPVLNQRIVALAALNDARDDELHDFARRFFRRIDSMGGSASEA